MVETRVGEKKLSRRDLLTGGWKAAAAAYPSIDGEKCTGCGLCVVHCGEHALRIDQDDEDDLYRIVLDTSRCTSCGVCASACPERCLRMDPADRKGRDADPVVLFEDGITRCSECGVPLFPRAMVEKLSERTRASGEPDIPFDLCPECRMKRQIVRGQAH